MGERALAEELRYELRYSMRFLTCRYSYIFHASAIYNTTMSSLFKCVSAASDAAPAPPMLLKSTLSAVKFVSAAIDAAPRRRCRPMRLGVRRPRPRGGALRLSRLEAWGAIAPRLLPCVYIFFTMRPQRAAQAEPVRLCNVSELLRV